MNLIPFRLIALAVFTEAGGGILAVAPSVLVIYVGALCRAESLEAIRDHVPVDLRHSFDNYLTVWAELLADVLEEDQRGPGGGLGDTVELTDQGAAAAASLEGKIDKAWDEATAGDGLGIQVGAQAPAPEPAAKPRKKSKKRIAAAGRRTRDQGRFAGENPSTA